MLASTSLSVIPDSLAKEPIVIVIAIDDTIIAKFGNKFSDRLVHAYVTSSSKGARLLFFSTASMPELHISSWISWQLWAGIRVMRRKSCKVLFMQGNLLVTADCLA